MRPKPQRKWANSLPTSAGEFGHASAIQQKSLIIPNNSAQDEYNQGHGSHLYTSTEIWCLKQKGCNFGGFFAIQNTEKETPDPFITSRDFVWKHSINTTSFKHLLSVRSNLCTAMVTLVSGSCFREKHTYKELHEVLHIFWGLSQANLPGILIFLIYSH